MSLPSMKQLNITGWLLFNLVYLGSLQIAGFAASFIPGVTGILASALTLTVVFLIMGYVLGFRMTVTSWVFFLVLGFIASMIASFVASAFPLATVPLSLVTGTIFYVLLRQFASKSIQKAVK